MEDINKAAGRTMNEYGNKSIPFLFIADFNLKKPLVIKLDELKKHNILYEINGLTSGSGDFSVKKDIRWDKFPVDYKTYLKSFENVQKHINFGNSYLTNLTFPTRVLTNLTLEEIFHRSCAKYKLLFRDEFIVFSPESFIKINDGIISTYSMKGTIDASVPDAGEKIMNDLKEKAEHCTIVDLMRNDLSMVSRHVRVSQFRYIEKIKARGIELLQVSSEISGKLEDNWNERIGDIIFSLLPAGSISGAPKEKTVEIIRESETYDRGYYTGVFGIFDGKCFDSAVMIRFIEKSDGEYYYKSGGGITASSDPVSEYQEMIDKVYVPIT